MEMTRRKTEKQKRRAMRMKGRDWKRKSMKRRVKQARELVTRRRKHWPI